MAELGGATYHNTQYNPISIEQAGFTGFVCDFAYKV